MKKLFYAVALATLFFTACNDKDDDPIEVVDHVLKGDITANKTLDASVEYSLEGSVHVKSGATLTIPAGTVIKAKKGFDQYILIERGAKIMAEGTAEKPILLTSAASVPASTDWGGLIINGNAPISGATAGTEGVTEIDNAIKYGGTNAADNSGVLKYVIIAYTGARSTANIEHNGLTLNAVGNGTVIENIYIPYSGDDGIEFFGGTVNVKNLLVVNSDDDMFDLTQGWTGTLDNAYGIWLSGYASTESDPRGVEADGNFDGLGADHVGQSDFTMQNITIVNNSGFEMQDGLKIRRGAKATITNCLITGTGKVTDVIDFTDTASAGNPASSINITNSLSNGNFTVEVKGTGNVTTSTTNTGANTTVFAWTGFTF
ncbi:hypothetical protein [Gaoshiqia sp. Z1-71]|uniref:hypothetical protein n=1 Tax=Gaoshiqia hydrogeniformans TaxID=3290090 RepID=UPI003BF77254